MEKTKNNKSLIATIMVSIVAVCLVPGTYFLAAWIYSIVPISASDMIDSYLPYVWPGLILSYLFYIVYIWIIWAQKEDIKFKSDKANQYLPIVRKITLILSYIACLALPIILLVGSLISGIKGDSPIVNSIFYFLFSFLAYILVLIIPRIYKNKTSKSLPHIFILALFNLLSATFLLSIFALAVGIIFGIVGLLSLFILSRIRILIRI